MRSIYRHIKVKSERNVGWIEYVDTNGVLKTGMYLAGMKYTVFEDTSLRECLVNTEQDYKSRLTRVNDCRDLSKEQLDTIDDYSARAYLLAEMSKSSDSLKEIQKKLEIASSIQGAKNLLHFLKVDCDLMKNFL